VLHRRLSAASAATSTTSHIRLRASISGSSRSSTVGVLQCRLVLKSPSIPIFYSRSTFLQFVDARLLTCIAGLLGLGFNLISVIAGLFPLWTCR
jgi:hypothetical protein